MKSRVFSIALTLLLACQAAPAVGADDWVDDEEVHGFYKRGVQHSPGDDYETAPGQVSGGGDDYHQPTPGEVGGSGPNFGLNPDQYNQGNMSFPQGNMSFPQSNAGTRSFQTPGQPPPKGILGKAKSFGKSLVRVPKDIMMGTGDLLDDPGLWQSAGAVAGMGANAYMNYRMMKNNPFYGPYGSPYSMGLGTPYGSVNPYLGFGNSVFNNPYMGLGTPYGSVNPYNMGFGNSVFNNPYNMGFGNSVFNNPYNMGFGRPYGSVNPLGGFGSPFIGTPYTGFGNTYGTGNPFYGSPYGSNPYFPYGTGAGTNLNPNPISPFGGLGLPGFGFR